MNPTVPWKPQRIASVVLSIIAVLANLSSILAITKVRGRLTSNLRYLMHVSIKFPNMGFDT